MDDTTHIQGEIFLTESSLEGPSDPHQMINIHSRSHYANELKEYLEVIKYLCDWLYDWQEILTFTPQV